MLTVGVIADTHGLLRPQAVSALEGSDLILHAGDAGSPEILARLREIAPVHAVRGNVDGGAWADELPAYLELRLESVDLLLHHGHLPLPAGVGSGARVVVQGHSHRPKLELDGDVLQLNPGSAGPRRFRLPVSVAILELTGTTAQGRLIDLLTQQE